MEVDDEGVEKDGEEEEEDDADSQAAIASIRGVHGVRRGGRIVRKKGGNEAQVKGRDGDDDDGNKDDVEEEEIERESGVVEGSRLERWRRIGGRGISRDRTKKRRPVE